ncbi:Glyoxalase [Vibrio crassostreae]|nr:Glyoxalase [Vibrio crassostreae]CAK2803100.1 Glyoxalase [Vibrio crassostreae]CAK3293046.1 Glyoxalase [Vibrio crassostreae]CAK3846463.1 Glyoxalase [Vibrio crassostreae]
MVKFGYCISYVESVEDTITFFETAFNMKRRFVTDSGDYGELNTGETILAFASHNLGEKNIPQGYIKATATNQPLGIEIALVTDDVESTHKNALANRGVEVKPPMEKPWGQIVSYVRSPSGLLLELCSPI